MIEHLDGMVFEPPVAPERAVPLMMKAPSPFGDQLLCPGCGGEYVHMDHVYAEVRREDHEVVHLHADLATGGLDLSPAGSNRGTYSARRHSLTLAMWCELCGGRWWFVFAQHKGVTEVALYRLSNTEPEED